ncbi:hypothetical protein HELRODRAFT_160031 [Helobdella robusta]|uniref:Uncharacterized protein n=1 Tax=Helobdella robusta TaxID=6412 RepID=T1EPP2_HELRO|nr:hypothetical protein HELRODRAFT_160031 [Helobdella robusta]ESO05933.1 hypothetical protein HELRODRAFT_160031 [Helobdella robusta]
MSKKVLVPFLEAVKTYAQRIDTQHSNRNILSNTAIPTPASSLITCPPFTPCFQPKPLKRSCLKKPEIQPHVTNSPDKKDNSKLWNTTSNLESNISSSLAVTNKLRETENIIEQLSSLESPLSNCPQKLLSYLEEIKNDLQENCRQMIRKQISKVDFIHSGSDKFESMPTKILEDSNEIKEIVENLGDEKIIKAFLRERGRENFDQMRHKGDPTTLKTKKRQPSPLFLSKDKDATDKSKPFQSIMKKSHPIPQRSGDEKQSLKACNLAIYRNTKETLSAEDNIEEKILDSYEVPQKKENLPLNFKDTLMTKEKVETLELLISKELDKDCQADASDTVLQKSDVKRLDSEDSTKTLTSSQSMTIRNIFISENNFEPANKLRRNDSNDNTFQYKKFFNMNRSLTGVNENNPTEKAPGADVENFKTFLNNERKSREVGSFSPNETCSKSRGKNDGPKKSFDTGSAHTKSCVSPEYLMRTFPTRQPLLSSTSSQNVLLENQFSSEFLSEKSPWLPAKTTHSEVLKQNKKKIKEDFSTINLLDNFVKELNTNKTRKVKSIELLLKNIELKQNEMKVRCKFAKNTYQNFLTNKIRVLQAISDLKTSKINFHDKQLIENLNSIDLDLLENTMCMILDSKKLSEMAEVFKSILLKKVQTNSLHKNKLGKRQSHVSLSEKQQQQQQQQQNLGANNSSKLPASDSKSSLHTSACHSCFEFAPLNAVLPDNYELIACNEYPQKIAGLTVLRNVMFVVLEDKSELFYSPLNGFQGNRLFWSHKYDSIVDPIDMMSSGEFLFILLANGRILKIDPRRNTSLEKILRLPYGLAKDAVSLSRLRSGNIMVINRSPGQLIEVDVNSKVVKVIRLPDELDDVSHVVQLSSQRFAVSCSGFNHRGVCLIDSKGNIMNECCFYLKKYKNLRPGLKLCDILKCPVHLAADDVGCIYVADTSKNCIIVLPSDLSCVNKIYFSKFPFCQPSRLFYHSKSMNVHFSCLSRNKWVVGSFKTSASNDL